MANYLNEKKILNATDLQGRDMDAVNFTVSFWKPSNQTDIPDGSVLPAQISTSPGSAIVVITILADILDEPSEDNRLWRYQIIEDITKTAWTPMCFEVKNRGQC